ncbi:MAG: hypothetical protein ACJA0H_000636 [Francisellaceae bacterium]|jgi:hypothetical protein
MLLEKNKDLWNNNFYLKSSFFNFCESFHHEFKKFNNWPTLIELSNILSSYKIYTHSLKKLIPCAQEVFDEEYSTLGYEDIIYEKGLIPTRENNWHDFFNILSWLTFPKSKSLLNDWQYSENQNKSGKNRTPLQNIITHFDECGMIILTDKPKLLELIYKHQWEEFFCQNKSLLESNIKFLTIGHSVSERLLSPYIGLTTKCLMFVVESDELACPNNQLVSLADDLCSKYLELNKNNLNTKSLQPFPMLGVTEIIKNNNFQYIQNQQYFRPKVNN